MGSPAIAFATVFLSLVFGLQPVELVVGDGDGVSRIELWLDGEVAGSVGSAPWKLDCDFGSSLQPHRLEAVAYDEAGGEISRATQWINLATPAARAGVVLEHTEGDRPYARLTWANLFGDAPKRVSMTLDGRPIKVSDPKRIALPRGAIDRLHFLRAQLEFRGNVSTVVEAVFGGQYGDQVSSSLTALPVHLTNGSRLPEVDRLQDWLVSAGRPISIAAVEKGDAEVVFIRDHSAQPALQGLLNPNRLSGPALWLTESGERDRYSYLLKKDQRIGFFWPAMEEIRPGLRLFPPTHGWWTPRKGGVGWLLASLPAPAGLDPEQRLADAAAVAGMNALARNRRRAVVLVLGESPEDRSQVTPAMAHAYLDSVKVPLYVWSPFPRPAGSPWGEVRDISTPAKLKRAVTDLAEALDRQRIVWIEGQHLPQRIGLSTEASGVDL